MSVRRLLHYSAKQPPFLSLSQATRCIQSGGNHRGHTFTFKSKPEDGKTCDTHTSGKPGFIVKDFAPVLISKREENTNKRTNKQTNKQKPNTAKNKSPNNTKQTQKQPSKKKFEIDASETVKRNKQAPLKALSDVLPLFLLGCCVFVFVQGRWIHSIPLLLKRRILLPKT